VFIRASNQQSDKDIAHALQFCDSRSALRRAMRSLVTCMSREHRMEDSINLERDEFRMSRHRAPAYSLSIIFSESRYALASALSAAMPNAPHWAFL
jgi:hypothetical protein